MTQTRYVLGFAFNNELDHVALIKKSRPDWQAGKWNGIGGNILDKEYPDSAMVREFKEETGVETVFYNWKKFCQFTGEGFDIECFTYRFNSTPNLDKLTDEAPNWWAIRYLPSDVIPNLRWLVPIAREVILTKEFSHYEIVRR
jgi:8-oxo-dGTP diphosphatase